jgi:ABC-2 type transport system permease protein
MVLGPFAIMAAFAFGYRDTTPPLRTIVVIPANSPLRQQADQYAKDLANYVRVVRVQTDLDAARRDLRDGRVDVVVSFPGEPMETLVEGLHPKIAILHTRLDPIEQVAINFASQLAIDQINAVVLAGVIAQGEQVAGPVNDALQVADTAVQQLDDAVQRGDAAAVDQALGQLDAQSPVIAGHATDIAGVLASLGGADATPAQAQELKAQIEDWSATLSRAHQEGANLDKATVQHMSQTLGTIRADVKELAGVDPDVLSQPFQPDVRLAVRDVNKVTDWYAPAAMIVILQQFGLAFGALTFVRERQTAIADVFKVAPITAGPSLIGRYLAYLLLGGIVGTALMVLTVQTLDVPLAGRISSTVAIMALTLFASLGLGFVISLLSKTDAQAVQYALLVLLATLFFSGFFLSVGRLSGAAKVVAWALPATYGMEMLRDVMLRGSDPEQRLLFGLLAYGAGMFLLSLLGSRRRMNARSS